MKYLLSLFVLFLILLPGCNSDEIVEEEESQIIVFQEAGDKQIVNTSFFASCFQVEIRDLENNLVEVPQEVMDSFDCFGAATTLSPDGSYLVYDHNIKEEGKVELKIYSFKDGNINRINGFRDGVEGLKCLWNDVGNLLGCASVNQEGYEGGTMMHIFSAQNGEISLIQEFEQPYEEMLDFVCGAECYPGNFWFESENLLKYQGI